MLDKKFIYSGLLCCALIPAGIAFSQEDEEKKRNPPSRYVEPKVKTELRTWLGVATSDVHPVLRQHLDLEEGFGVQISHVPEDSPAHTSGIKAGDILTKFGDQLLISPEHLSILVRSKSKGDKVDITFLRKGDEQTIDVTLGEKDLPVMPRGHGAVQVFPGQGSGQPPHQWQYWPKNFQFKFEDFTRRPGARNNFGGDGEGRDRPRRPGMEKDRLPQGPPPVKKKTDNAPPPKPVAPRDVIKSNSVVKIDNDKGEITLTRKDGKTRIEICDPEGGVIFDGPYDAKKGVNGLPPDARDHLKKMKVKIDDLAPPEPKKKNSPGKNKPGETL